MKTKTSLCILFFFGIFFAGCSLFEVLGGARAAEIATEAAEVGAEATTLERARYGVSPSLNEAVLQARNAETSAYLAIRDQAGVPDPIRIVPFADEGMVETAIDSVGEYQHVSGVMDRLQGHAGRIAALEHGLADFGNTARSATLQAGAAGIAVGGAGAGGYMLYQHHSKAARCSMAIQKAKDTSDFDEKTRALEAAERICKDL